MRATCRAFVSSVTLLLFPAWAWPTEDVTLPDPTVQATEPAPDAPPQTQAPDAQTASSGQWVYTQQYGWVWMPYGDAYSYVPPDGEGEPYEYVYYPSYGWTWGVGPWVWGYGPLPEFG